MKTFLTSFFAAMMLMAAVVSAGAQQVKRSPFDVSSYLIDAQLNPVENKLTATADVTFVPGEDTRSVTFELNGSLKVDSVSRIDKAFSPSVSTPAAKAKVPAATVSAAVKPLDVTFVQDQVGVSDLGPSVRVDLGDTIAKDKPVTLRFKYSGALNTPSGGPLLNKRLAFIGADQGYLMYAARWFPFHNYAADLATSDITLSLPSGMQMIGYSDSPAVSTGGKYHFVQSKPGLVGNFAYSKYLVKNLKFGEYSLNFYTRPGFDSNVQSFGETIGRALEFYSKSFGTPSMGKVLNVAQIDDESLDYYSANGILFISSRQFEQPREATIERLQREAAYQWWGLTVGLKSFDDVWLSQGLAEYSAFTLRESLLTGAKLDFTRRELLEKALTFEQTASLLRAPANLDDQSIAYQYIMFGKGAAVFRLLRETIGASNFTQLLRLFLNEFRDRNASIDDFEKLTNKVAGQNMRYFFARWVESTGVPEFSADYQIIRTRAGKFIARGTVKQNYDNLKLPLDVMLRSEGEGGSKTVTVQMQDATADFNIEADGKPLAVVIDPGYKVLRISPDLRVSSIARRGIEQMKEGNFADAQTQFEAALKLDRSNSWIYYHLGLLFLEQRNYDLAIDNFKAALGGNINPAWLQVWANIKMGNAYDAKGDRTRAIAMYKRAEALGDNYDNAQDAIKKYQATPFDPKEKDATAVK
ncbi:MAG: M1 family aminopeptidase [Pyrinomonadaceae bacterium]